MQVSVRRWRPTVGVITRLALSFTAWKTFSGSQDSHDVVCHSPNTSEHQSSTVSECQTSKTEEYKKKKNITPNNESPANSLDLELRIFISCRLFCWPTFPWLGSHYKGLMTRQQVTTLILHGMLLCAVSTFYKLGYLDESNLLVIRAAGSLTTSIVASEKRASHLSVSGSKLHPIILRRLVETISIFVSHFATEKCRPLIISFRGLDLRLVGLKATHFPNNVTNKRLTEPYCY